MKLPWLTSPKSRSRARKTRLELEALEGRLVPAGGPVPDFSLPDLNPNSPTAGQNIGPATFLGSVSGYYFADAA